jgi:hypothetical protein
LFRDSRRQRLNAILWGIYDIDLLVKGSLQVCEMALLFFYFDGNKGISLMFLKALKRMNLRLLTQPKSIYRLPLFEN